MITPNVFQLFRGGRALRSYRANLRDTIRQEPAIRLLPGLLDLPLATEGLAAIIQHFDQFARIALCGEIGSGRTLLLQQVAAGWAGDERSERVLYLSLARSDAPNLSPRAVLAAAIHTTGLSSPLNERRPVSDQRAWLLLIDDWEDLPPQRQQVWRTYIERLPHTWPAARVLVALPAAVLWPNTHAVMLGEPDDQQLRRWINHLLPGYDQEAILAALAPDQPLASLRSSVRDIALLAVTFPVYGMPPSRTRLYEHAAALVGPVVTAAEREASGALAGGVGLDPATFYTIGAPSWRDYNLAREVAAGDPAELVALAPHRRADVLPSAAALISNPARIYELLWGDGRPSAANLRILGACLREQPAAAPIWCLRLLEILEDAGSAPELATLRWNLGPAFPGLLAAAGRADEARTIELLGRGSFQPGALALLRLVDDPAASVALRWAAADQLSTRTIEPTMLFDVERSLDEPARAARAYLLATGTSAMRRALAEPAAHDWLAALSGASVAASRQAAAARGILSDEEAAQEVRATALSLIASFEPGLRRELLGGACADPSPMVRKAAFKSLDDLSAAERLLVLSRVVATPGLDSAALHDALDRLSMMNQGEASALLARCVLSNSLPLDGRLRALEAIAWRGAGPLLLARLIRVETLHPVVRAAVAYWLGQMRVIGALPDLRDLALERTVAPPLRLAAVAALGRAGALPEGRELALAPLLRLLVEPSADTVLLVEAIRAVGKIPSAAALPLLDSLLQEGAADRIRAAWRAVVPQAVTLPPEQWLAVALPAAERLTLQSMLAAGETSADQPTSFEELVERQVEQVRAAAADSLADLALLDANLRDEAARSLHQALHRRLSAGLIRHLLGALARLRPDGGLRDLGRLLADPLLDTAVCWLALEQLGDRPQAAPLLIRYLQPGAVDGFIAARLAELLGRNGALEGLSVLSRLADSAASLQLREAAVAALGSIHDPTVESILLDKLINDRLPLSLRIVAAEALPAALTAATRQTLRDLLRNERPPAALAAALIRSLGRADDHEALSLLIHFAQSEQISESLAAIEALALPGDQHIAPILVRINQNPAATAEVRLAAAGTLLQLGGLEYLPLLQSVVSSGSLSLQLQAFTILQQIFPGSPILRAPLTDRAAPLALRLRAVELVVNHDPEALQLLTVLLDEQAPLQLRVAVAVALGRAGTAGAIEPLSALAGSTATAPLLRHKAIEALAALVDSPQQRAARLALSRIAADTAMAIEGWGWAAAALINGYSVASNST